MVYILKPNPQVKNYRYKRQEVVVMSPREDTLNTNLNSEANILAALRRTRLTDGSMPEEPPTGHEAYAQQFNHELAGYMLLYKKSAKEDGVIHKEEDLATLGIPSWAANLLVKHTFQTPNGINAPTSVTHSFMENAFGALGDYFFKKGINFITSSNRKMQYILSLESENKFLLSGDYTFQFVDAYESKPVDISPYIKKETSIQTDKTNYSMMSYAGSLFNTALYWLGYDSGLKSVTFRFEYELTKTSDGASFKGTRMYPVTDNAYVTAFFDKLFELYKKTEEHLTKEGPAPSFHR